MAGVEEQIVGASIEISSSEFEQIRKLAYQHFGLDLKQGKQMLVVARLGKLLRAKGFKRFRDYYAHVMQDRSGEAIVEMVDALTTNFTSFMREASHFDFLRRKIGPVLAKRNQARIWCAAAATGQEPYSILFTLLDTLGPDADVRVLATDISTKALASVASAVYSDSAVSGLPRGWLDRFFIKGNGRWAGWHRVKAELRARVECRRFNLLSSELPDKQFPAIFCRNVMIYFDRPTQELVIHRLVQRLEPGGYFFVGHSETANCARQELTYVMPAVYRKGDQWQSKR